MPPPANHDEALPPRRRIGDADLQADGQGALDADARAAVEGSLQPHLAGQAMTVLHMRGRIQLGVRGVATLAEALDPAVRTSDHLAARPPTAAA